jgi:SAM-dependent methyltransferase
MSSRLTSRAPWVAGNLPLVSSPPGLTTVLKRYVPRSVRRSVTRARFGDLRHTEPVSEWGFGRGTPVDRWYIERYLAERAHLVHGRALEVKEDLYASRFGAQHVDVLDIDPENSSATIVGDLCDISTLPSAAYDVAVVTQTLQLVPRPVDAIRNLVAALRPGGSLVLTVPAVSRLAGSTDRWRWTPMGMRDLLSEAAPSDADIEIVGLGNNLSARAFLFGLAVHDLDERVLEHSDPDYPMVVGACVRPSP